MPIEVTVKLYKFNELDDKAKEKARDWFRESWDSHDSDDISLAIREHISIHHGLESEGYEPGTLEAEDNDKQSLKIWWSLSSCQGDGVAFEGRFSMDALAKKQPEVRKLVRRLKRFDASYSVQIKHFGHYYHWNSMEVEAELYDVRSLREESDAHYQARREKAADLVEDLRKTVHELLKDISRDAAKAGYQEIEYKQSNEYVDECIEANEYTFREDGRRADD